MIYEGFQPAEPEEEKPTKHSFYILTLTAVAQHRCHCRWRQSSIYGCEYIHHRSSHWLSLIYHGDHRCDAWAFTRIDVWETFRDCGWFGTDRDWVLHFLRTSRN